MFFGCRQRDQDFYWQTEWQKLEQKGCLTLVTAFSREQVSALRLGRTGVGRAELSLLTPAGTEGVCAAPAPGAGRACLGAAGCPRSLLLPSRVSQLSSVGRGPASQGREGWDWSSWITELSEACLSSNAKYMPTDVSEALMSIFREEGRLSTADASAYLARLQQTLRFQTETWA